MKSLPKSKTQNTTFDNCSRVILWDADSQSKLAEIEGIGESVGAIAFSNDAKELYLSNGDELLICNAFTQEIRKRFKAHKGEYITDIACFRNKDWVITSSWDRTATVWDSKTWRPVYSLADHEDKVDLVAISPGEKQIVTATREDLIIWRSDDGQLVDSFKIPELGITCISFVRDEAIMIGCSDGSLCRIDIASKSLRLVTKQPSCINEIDSSANGEQVLVGCVNGEISVWDFKDDNAKRRFQVIESDSEKVAGVAFMKDDRSFVASSERGGIQFCDSSDGTTLSRFRPWQGFVQNVDMTNDGRYLGTAVVEHPYEIGPTVKKHVHIWNTQRNQLDQKIQVDCNSIDCLDFSPSGKRLAAAASLDTYVWDRESGRRISKTSSKSGGVWTVALDRDGDRVAIGTINGLLAIVHAESGKEIFSFQKICECIGAVEFVENKEQLIIGRYRSDDIKEFDFVKERFNCSSQYLI